MRPPRDAATSVAEPRRCARGPRRFWAPYCGRRGVGSGRCAGRKRPCPRRQALGMAGRFWSWLHTAGVQSSGASRQGHEAGRNGGHLGPLGEHGRQPVVGRCSSLWRSWRGSRDDRRPLYRTWALRTSAPACSERPALLSNLINPMPRAPVPARTAPLNGGRDCRPMVPRTMPMGQLAEVTPVAPAVDDAPATWTTPPPFRWREWNVPGHEGAGHAWRPRERRWRLGTAWHTRPAAGAPHGATSLDPSRCRCRSVASVQPEMSRDDHG